MTNVEQTAAVRREMRGVPASQILAEPVGTQHGRGNRPCGDSSRAFEHGDALMAVLPSDSYIGNANRTGRWCGGDWNWRATPGNLVVLGIPPSRPETGYGYIERGSMSARPARCRRIRGPALHGEAEARACAKKYRRVEAILLERRDVFLARVDVSGLP